VPHSWVRHSLELIEQGPCVLVTLRRHKGSAPRESGARMVVGKHEIRGSIGGGNLEFQAIATAREMLAKARNRGEAPLQQGDEPAVGAAPSPRIEPYGLGPALNQCCGGSVELLFELIDAPAPEWLTVLSTALEHGDRVVLATATNGDEARHVVALSVGRESSIPESLRETVGRLRAEGQSGQFEVGKAEGLDWWLECISADKRPLILFGAGHVGKAVAKIFEDLPFQVRWIDRRKQEFPEYIPSNALAICTEDFEAEIRAAAPESIFIVMTHSHDLDEQICHAVLERGDFAFLGLIGSTSKHRRFLHRLGKRGISEAALERLVCPIGLPAIAGKEPATIALSLAAQLMSAPD
jgi:xanthine dehydrogenase accessory factor